MNIAFMVILGLSLLVDLALGAWAGADFQGFARMWGLGGTTAGTAAPFLGWVLATCLIGFAAIQGISLYWTRREKDEGPQLAIVFGCWLILSSVATFAWSRGPESEIHSLGWNFLLVDGLRGVLVTLFGFLALQAPSVVRELRLPDRVSPPRRREERSGRARHERRDERPRHRGREREEGHREGRRRPDEDRVVARGREEPSRRPEADEAGGRDREDRRGERRGEGRGERRGGRSGERRRDSGGRDERRPGRRRETPAPAAPDPESQDAAEARRITPTSTARPLTVVVKGPPERIRALASEEVRLEEEQPFDQPGTETFTGADGSVRRRRRRRRRRSGGAGEGLIGDPSAAAEYEDLDDPVVVERDVEERAGDDSGEWQEGATAARARNRRRPGREDSADSTDSTEAPEERSEREQEKQPEPHRASPVEALDMLRLLEPTDPRVSSSPRPVDDHAFGRTSRPARRRPGGPPRRPDDD